MPRGGRRKGAGAPRGNLNALKHGRYSRQFAEIGALLAMDPTVRESLLHARRRTEQRQHTANEIAAARLVGLYRRALDIAAGRHPGGLQGLNLALPRHVSETINQAAAEALRRQARIAARESRKNRADETTINPGHAGE